ncbi:MAG: FmdB family zinc ribbon protein [Isosphaeraceae bacterium]
MPIYEYHCKPCDHIFEALVRGPSDAARCPRCGNIDVAKQFSVPASVHSGRSNSLPMYDNPSTSSFGCGRPECGSGHCAFE